MTGESASLDHVAAAIFLVDLTAIIAVEGYSPKQVFNVDETAVFGNGRYLGYTYLRRRL